MARGRFISKGISLDEKVNALPDDTARLLFTWMITHLDCEGRTFGEAGTIKSLVFPRRVIPTKKIENYLKILANCGLILRYSVNGNQYIFMPNFEKHQPGLNKKREAPSQIPPCTPELLQSNSGNGDGSNSGVTPELLQSQEKEKEKDQVKAQGKDKDKESSSSSMLCIGVFEVEKAYSENIGEVTPALRQELEKAVHNYGGSWVNDAIKEAINHNRPLWSYARGILQNWRDYGKGNPASKYAQGVKLLR